MKDLRDPFVAADYLRTKMGDLTPPEVQIAIAAYRVGYWDAVAYYENEWDRRMTLVNAIKRLGIDLLTASDWTDEEYVAIAVSLRAGDDLYTLTDAGRAALHAMFEENRRLGLYDDEDKK